MALDQMQIAWLCKDHTKAEMAKIIVAGRATIAQREDALATAVSALQTVVSDCQLAIDALGNSPAQFDSTKSAFGIVRDRARAAIARARGEQA